MKVQALTTVCAGEWSSMSNLLSLASNFFLFFPLSNYLRLQFLTWQPFFL